MNDEFERIQRMSEAELDAALIAEGIDPDDAAERTRQAVAEAVALAAERHGSAVCRLCGQAYPHQHTPDEMLIYKNGVKRGVTLSACGCERCDPIRIEIVDGHFDSPNMRMIVCAICGNKRCPHAADHRNACTNSNEPGQPGSSYPVVFPSP